MKFIIKIILLFFVISTHVNAINFYKYPEQNLDKNLCNTIDVIILGPSLAENRSLIDDQTASYYYKNNLTHLITNQSKIFYYEKSYKRKLCITITTFG